MWGLEFREQARQVIAERGWDWLVVPRGWLEEIGGKWYLIQEKLAIGSAEETQHLWQEACAEPTPEFQKLVEQLCDFVVETDWDDVDFRNLPMIGGQVMLIDLEKPHSGREFGTGILGEWKRNSRGLLRCVSAEMGRKLVERLPEGARGAARDVVGLAAFRQKKGDPKLPVLQGDPGWAARLINAKLEKGRSRQVALVGVTDVVRLWSALDQLVVDGHIYSWENRFGTIVVEL